MAVLPDVQIYQYMYGFFKYERIRVRIEFFWEFNLISAKNSDYIEKYFKQKLSKIKFPTKNSLDAYHYLTQKWN